ncbi:hypothetical protein [Bosea sp. 685]|uniref:hypothetical protein n=1 Tax=Bosea sp. 685 TaxID=3080057 RepID=UPI0028933139|nr:hypothetical protein [Bosea sp. 685]WNJ91759.1 hypothetical protein RMR04_05480 [Bosea sp. 685]
MGKDKHYRIGVAAALTSYDQAAKTKVFTFPPSFPFTGYDFKVLIFTLKLIDPATASATLYIKGGTTGRYSTGDNILHDHYVVTLKAGPNAVSAIDVGRWLMTHPDPQEATLQSKSFNLIENQFKSIDSVWLDVEGMQQD